MKKTIVLTDLFLILSLTRPIEENLLGSKMSRPVRVMDELTSMSMLQKLQMFQNPNSL